MLKKIFKSTNAIDKARYDTEKVYNQKLKVEYASLEKLNKAYDLLTQKAEKEFEQKERSFVKEKTQHETLYNQKESDLAIEQEQERTLKQDNLNGLKRRHKEQFEALKLNHKKSLLILENECDELDQEKQLALKEIEKDFSANTAIFEDKLKLFKKNLEKNKHKTDTLFEKHIKELKDLTDKETTVEPLFQDFHVALNALEETLNAGFKQQETQNEDDLKTILSLVNKQRKNLNQTLKHLTMHIYKVHEKLNEPFVEIENTFKSFVSDIKEATSTFTKKVQVDYDIEHVRTETALNNEEEPLDPKEIKDFKTRLKLAEQRRDTLLDNAKDLSEMYLKDIAYLESQFNKEKTDIVETFDKQDSILKDIHQHFKNHFSLLEEHFKMLFSTQSNTLKTNHNLTILHEFKDYVKQNFDILAAFEKERIDLLIEVSNASLSKVQKIDEISMDLDTVEALKEIEISKAKLKIEQENYGVRFDMRMAKINHDIDLKNAKNTTHLEEQKYVNEMTLVQETHKLQNLLAKQKHQKMVLSIENKDRYSELIYKLRKNHIEHEIIMLEKKYQLDIEKLNTEHSIETINLEKDHHLNELEIEKEITEKTLQIRTDIDHQKQVLHLSLDKKRQLTEQIENHYEETYKERQETYDEALLKAQNEIDTLGQKHQEKNAFINRALEKETLQPKQQIKEIKTLLDHRIQLISSAKETVFKPLTSTEIALNNREPKLKDLLLVIAKPYLRAVEEYAGTLYQITNESHTFIHNISLKQIENDASINPKRKETKIQKEKLNLEKIIKHNEKLQEQLIQHLVPRLKQARELINSEANTTILNIKQIILPLTHLIHERLNQETKAVKASLKTLFEALYKNDRFMIEHARSQHKIALEQATNNYQEQLKPLESKLEALQDDKNKALNEVDTLKENALAKKLEPIESTLEDIRKKIQSLEHEKTNIEQSFEAEVEILKQDFINKKSSLTESQETAVEVLKARVDEKILKLKTKDEDAKGILEYEKKIHQNEAEHFENVLEETLNQNQSQYEQQLKKLQSALDNLENQKQNAINEAILKLENTNKSYEDRMMRTTARVDAATEQVSRQIDQEAALKRNERERLTKQIHDLEDSLNQELSESLLRLNTRLKDALNTYLFDDEEDHREESVRRTIDSHIKVRNTFTENLIENTLKSIINHDE